MKNLKETILERLKLNKDIQYTDFEYDEVFDSGVELRKYLSKLKELDTNAISFITSYTVNNYPIYLYKLDRNSEYLDKFSKYLNKWRNSLKIDHSKTESNSISGDNICVLSTTNKNHPGYLEIMILDMKLSKILFYMLSGEL